MMGLGSFGDLHLGRREMLHMGLSGRSCRESQELSKLYSKPGSTTAPGLFIVYCAANGAVRRAV